jgi:hypothetical protein
LGIAAFDILALPQPNPPWPWWTIFGVSIVGIVYSAVKRGSLFAGQLVLVWNLVWYLAYSLSVVSTLHSTHSTVSVVLRTECIISAIVNLALCVLAFASLRFRLGIFAAANAAALILVAFAIRSEATTTWHAAAWTAVGAAVVALVIRRPTYY